MCRRFGTTYCPIFKDQEEVQEEGLFLDFFPLRDTLNVCLYKYTHQTKACVSLMCLIILCLYCAAFETVHQRMRYALI
jgi:hypothetical protein